VALSIDFIPSPFLIDFVNFPLGANTSITVRGVPVVGLLIEVAGNSVIIVSFVWFGFMVFNATFNNISVISWWSVLLVEETGGPGENHRPAESH
jgi:hypothetical protein